jgi:hypothetical protein
VDDEANECVTFACVVLSKIRVISVITFVVDAAPNTVMDGLSARFDGGPPSPPVFEPQAMNSVNEMHAR